MDRSTKLYAIALKKYQNGYIDKALEICEECISLNLKNAAALNLKGLLLYLKGELSNAKSFWKLNYQMNKDGVASSYLENSKNDEERESLYTEAINYIKQVHIVVAIQILKKCAQSDYNSINVNNYLAICYIKTGKYEDALIYINKVLILDKKNKMAKGNLKILKKFGGISIPMNYTPFKYAFSGIVIIVLVTYLGSYGISRIKGVKDKSELKKVEKRQPIVVVPKEEKQQQIVTVPKEEVIFPYEQIKTEINNQDMKAMYGSSQKWKDVKLKSEDRKLITMEQEVLKTEGVSYFYKLGSSAHSNGDMKNAKQSLLIAYELGLENPLYPHVIYTLGSTLEKMNDLESAFKYYEEYLVKYPSGNYEEVVLYKLATLNKNVDNQKSKIYAQKLVDKYPTSQYNNSVITWILSQ
jgi:tetratricopeptide (TPR) repeat protein